MSKPQIEVEKVNDLIDWTSKKVLLHLKSTQGFIPVKRGEVYWCYLGENVGSEENKRRPCLVIQHELRRILDKALNN